MSDSQTKTIRKDSRVYAGVWEDWRNGTGTITYENGSVYTGAWEEGLPHGQGTMDYTRGIRLVTAYSNPYMTAHSSPYMRYEGGCEHGRKSGHGTMHYYDGSVYKGEWEMGLRNGFGTMEYGHDSDDGAGVYKGKFLRDRRSGQGTMRSPNSEHHWDEYKGEWRNGGKDGHGTMKSGDGWTYEGGWRNGVENGRGELTYAQEYTFDGKQEKSYIGNWYAGQVWLSETPSAPELISQILLTSALRVVATSKEPAYAAHMRHVVLMFVHKVGFHGHDSLKLDDFMGLKVWPILIQACRVAYEASRCLHRQWQLRQMLSLRSTRIPERIIGFAGDLDENEACYTMSTFLTELMRKFQAAQLPDVATHLRY